MKIELARPPPSIMGSLFIHLSFELVSLLSNGLASACVGPTIDVQLHTSETKHTTDIHNALLAIKTDYLYFTLTLTPSVYDALVVIRPSILLQDSSSALNFLGDNTHHIFSLPINSSSWLSLIGLGVSFRALNCIEDSTPSEVISKVPHSSVSMRYSSDLTTFLTVFNRDFFGINRCVEETVLGFTTVFFMSKSYSNFLVCEASQLCFGGVIRAVSLGTTDGLCTWRVSTINTYQPVTVPVGRITLGRIFNVTGSSLDGFLEIPSFTNFSWSQFLGTIKSTTGYYSAHAIDYITSSCTLHTMPSTTLLSTSTLYATTNTQLRFFEVYSKCYTHIEPSELHITCLHLQLSSPLVHLGLPYHALKSTLHQPTNITCTSSSSWPLTEH